MHGPAGDGRGPLRSLYRDEFAVAPLMVLVDSSRFSSDEIEARSIGGYLRKHQVEEAEYVILSKVDMISKARISELIDAVRSLNPAATVIPYSAITGQGLDDILKVMDSDLTSKGSPVDVDYDTYADAEAELGWYNGLLSFRVSGWTPMSWRARSSGTSRRATIHKISLMPRSCCDQTRTRPR